MTASRALARDRAAPFVRALIVFLALAAVTAWGVWLRLQDPLTTPHIAAEDPYTHIVYTKEHLARGAFDLENSMWTGGAMYPPGLHTLLGVLHATTGTSLMVLGRLLPPVLFGGLAVTGTFLLAHRLGGWGAGLVAATVTAGMPEHVMRTNLLFPTGLDLAVLPFLLLAVVELAEGRWRWAWIAAPAGVALALAHPWVIPLATLGVGAYAFLRVLAAPAREMPWRLVPAGVVIALFAFLVWLSLNVPPSESHMEGIARDGLGTGPLLVGAGVLVALGLVIARAIPVPLPRWTRGALGAVAAAAVLAVLLPPVTADLPRFVAYGDMIGWAPVALALAAVVLLPFRPTRLGLLGFGVAATTFPLTAINVFDSPFWPHRTVAYMSLGVALLAGAAVLPLARGAHLAYAPVLRGPGFRQAVTAGVAVVLAAGVVAAAPEPWSWYRLYDEDDYGAVTWAAATLDADPDAVVVTARWQPDRMLKSEGDPERVHYDTGFFKDADAREERLATHAGKGPVYVLVDAYHRDAADEKGWDLAFEDEGYEPVGTWGEVTVYRAPVPDA